MINHDLIIIGGGASGLMAAICAKDFGIDVAIIEGTDRIGKKILTTGNGRCNISNNTIAAPFKTYHSNNSNFFTHTLSTFSVENTRNFFLSLGLPTVELKNGKLYPQSLQASSVVDIFRLALEDKNIPLYTDKKIKTIHKGKVFKLSTADSSDELFTCNKLILACGGSSAVKTGSDGTGYNLAKSFNHKITKTLPSIVQLHLKHPSLKALSGVKFDGNVTLEVANKIEKTEFGEVLFTDYGISGPPILQLSGHCSRALSQNKEVNLIVDMLPTYSEDELINFLEGHLAIFSHRPVIDAFIGIIHKKLIPILLKEAGVSNLQTPCYDLDWKIKKKIFNLLKGWKFNCIATNGFAQAQVTIGGVDTKDINPLTLESKLVDNLYFCGEILDVDGDCGGYNLQWAWSSGYCVAKAISEK